MLESKATFRSHIGHISTGVTSVGHIAPSIIQASKNRFLLLIEPCCILANLHLYSGGAGQKQRAQIAQLVEQRIENPRVAGSIPALGTIFSRMIL
jgi:hypothetical protein